LPAVIDHLVVTSPSRETGSAWVTEMLGVPLREGGAHARMGTHNALLRLGDAVYLEVLAIDPNALAPPRPRWFGLDRPAPPRLAGWIVRTSDILATVAAASVPLGEVEPMERGDLRWRITIPADGRLPLGGMAPGVIEWPDEKHPAGGLPDSGCRLLGLEIDHPEGGEISRLLDSIGFDGPVDVRVGKVPRLVASIATPSGVRRLGDA
jgi:hypothetical protein